jgi:hypothetical protein
LILWRRSKVAETVDRVNSPGPGNSSAGLRFAALAKLTFIPEALSIQARNSATCSGFSFEPFFGITLSGSSPDTSSMK